MFGKIGTGELLVVLLVALIIFGPSKLPALGKMAGKAIGTLRHYADSNNWEELLEEEERETSAQSKGQKSTAQDTKAEASQEAPVEADAASEDESGLSEEKAS